MIILLSITLGLVVLNSIAIGWAGWRFLKALRNVQKAMFEHDVLDKMMGKQPVIHVNLDDLLDDEDFDDFDDEDEDFH